MKDKFVNIKQVHRKFREREGVASFFATVNKGSEANATTAVEDEEELTVVRTKRFDLKPMDEEEAILQMNMLGHNFFIFTDGESNETNIVYKRKDGKYGLIETN